VAGIDKLKAGDFNIMNQTPTPEGNTIVTLVKRGEGKVYRFEVADLYNEKEKVLWEEVTEG